MKKLLIGVLISSLVTINLPFKNVHAAQLKVDNIKTQLGNQLEPAKSIELPNNILEAALSNNENLKQEIVLVDSKTEKNIQENTYRLLVTGNYGYASEVDYTVRIYSTGQRDITINWYNVDSPPFYVPVRSGIALHKYSGSTYNMDFWTTPTIVSQGTHAVNKTFSIPNNWTVQVEARTVYAIGVPKVPGTTYIPRVKVSNH